MKHPFDQEAVEAAYHARLNNDTSEDILQAAWDSMFARGQMIGDIETGTFYICKDPTP